MHRDVKLKEIPIGNNQMVEITDSVVVAKLYQNDRSCQVRLNKWLPTFHVLGEIVAPDLYTVHPCSLTVMTSARWDSNPDNRPRAKQERMAAHV